MDMLTGSLLWCVAQVTLVALLTWLLRKLLSKATASSATALPATALAVVTLLTASAFVPWPNWWRFGPRLESPPSPSAMVAKKLQTSAAATKYVADQYAGPLTPVEAMKASGGGEFDLKNLPDASKPQLADAQPTWSALWGRLPLIIAGVFSCGALLGLVQLLGGIFVIRGYKQHSLRLHDSRIVELVDCLRAELSIRQAVEILECKRLATAATIGWFRPVILLPPGWRDWTGAQLRAVLAHELAHVARGDFLMCAFAQLALVLHFYHPLVHWLVGTLRSEQEFAADATAAALSGGRKLYLQSLAELALDASESPLGWPAHTFLPTQGTFLRRIEMLRDFQTTTSAGARPFLWRLTAVGLLMIGSIVIAGMRGGPASLPFAETANAQVPVAANDTQRIDLSHVTNDAKMLLAIRPAELAKIPELTDLLKKTVDDGSLPFAKLMMEGVQQVTFVSLTSQNAGNAVIVLQFHKPTTFNEVAKSGAWPAEAQQLPAAADAKPHHQAYSQLNDQTIVLGSTDMVGRYLASRRRGQPAIVAGAAGERLSNSAVMFALDMEMLRDEFGSDNAHPAKAQLITFLAPVAPLWSDSEYLVGGMRVEGKEIHLHAIATCHDAKLAESVEETARAATTFARNLLRSLKENERGIPDYVQKSMEAVDELLKSIKVERMDKLVAAQTSTDLPAVGSAVAKNLTQAISASRVAAQRTVSMNNLKQIMLAHHNWADSHDGRLPPPVIMGKDGKGKVPHSWRVELLPYLDQLELYNMYQFDEPWDSEANKRVLAKMPAVLRHPHDDPKSNETAYFVLTSEKLLEATKAPGGGLSAPEGGFPTAFSCKSGLPFALILDGMSNTLAVVEAKRAIPWTKPDDILFDPAKDPPNLGGYFKEGFNAAICDGSVRFVTHAIDPKVLKLLIMPGDGSPIPGF